MVKDGLVPRGVIDGRDELCASSMNGKDAVWGKIFPTFMSALGNFLHEQRPSFSGIDLLVPPRWDPVKFMCLGPHCQCAFLAPRRQSANPQYVFASGPRRNGQLGRLVKLPAWVANSPRVAAQAESRYSPAPIRFHVRDRSSPPPSGVNQANKFRDRIRATRDGSVSCCQVSLLLPSIFDDIDGALVGAITFVKHIIEEKKKLYGPEGVNAGYARVTKAMFVCFDWERLLTEIPKAQDVKEFAVLSTLLKPYLRHTQWPDRDEWPNVTAGRTCRRF